MILTFDSLNKIDVSEVGFIQIESDECKFTKYLFSLNITSESNSPQIILKNVKNH